MNKNKIISSIERLNTFKLLVGGEEITISAKLVEMEELNKIIHSVSVQTDKIIVYCNRDEFSEIYSLLLNIVIATPNYFKDEDALANHINHLLFKFRTRELQSLVNSIIKKQIKLYNLKNLTTNRRRGGRTPSSNHRDLKTQISLLIRQPVSFSDEMGLPASSLFKISTKRNSIIFFLHAIPKDYQNIGKGFKNYGIKFRHYKSIEFPHVQSLEFLKYMSDVFEYPSKNIQFNRLIENGDLEPFIANLLKFFDGLIDDANLNSSN